MKTLRALIIRWILTLALIYGAYTETGKFTALTLLLISVSVEISSYSEKDRPNTDNQ